MEQVVYMASVVILFVPFRGRYEAGVCLGVDTMSCAGLPYSQNTYRVEERRISFKKTTELNYS